MRKLVAAGLVAFFSAASNLVGGDDGGMSDIFVHDLETGETERVSVSSAGNQADAVSTEPTISEDGRYVAFRSLAANLAAGDSAGSWDIFVHDRDDGATIRVSIAVDATAADHDSALPAISADGRYVCFDSDATNLGDDDTNLRGDIFIARNPQIP